MSVTSNHASSKGIDDEGSAVSGAPGRHLTPMRKIGVAGLVLVVLLAFIWINQLNKATQQVKQPDMAFSTGGAFHAPPSQPDTPAATPASLPMPAAAPATSILRAGRARGDGGGEPDLRILGWGHAHGRGGVAVSGRAHQRGARKSGRRSVVRA